MTKAVTKIAVFTGTRAEFGLLQWILADLQADPRFELQLVVTGTHLVDAFGATESDIVAQGLPIAWRCDMLLASDSATATGKSMGLGLVGYADALAHLKPDYVLILGDRFEMLSAAIAAFVARVPIAHLHGGEVTTGALDDGFRHAITKLAHLHFAAAEPYRKRIIQLGEAPERVFTVGAPGLEHLRRTPLPSRAELGRELGFGLPEKGVRPVLLVTFHPETASAVQSQTQFEELRAGLESLPDALVIFTLANADPGGRAINQAIEQLCRGDDDARFHAFASLGQHRYLALLREADAVVGNSSSGIIEAPAFGTPTVNIGDRQAGRLRAASIIDCPARRDAIAKAIQQAICPSFFAARRGAPLPYGDGNCSARILNVLADTPPTSLGPKGFHDLPTTSLLSAGGAVPIT